MNAEQPSFDGFPRPPKPRRKVRVKEHERILPEPPAKRADGKPARAPQKETSRAARASVEGEVANMRSRILEYIRTHDGATRDELCDRLHMENQTVCPRVLELIRAGSIQESKDVRPTRKGRAARVLRAVVS